MHRLLPLHRKVEEINKCRLSALGDACIALRNKYCINCCRQASQHGCSPPCRFLETQAKRVQLSLTDPNSNLLRRGPTFRFQIHHPGRSTFVPPFSPHRPQCGSSPSSQRARETMKLVEAALATIAVASVVSVATGFSAQASLHPTTRHGMGQCSRTWQCVCTRRLQVQQLGIPHHVSTASPKNLGL